MQRYFKRCIHHKNLCLKCFGIFWIYGQYGPYMIMCHVSRDRSFLTLPSLGVDSTFLRYSLNRYLSTNSDNVIKGGVQLLRHAI